MFTELPAITVHDQSSLTQTNCSASCLCFYTNELCWYRDREQKYSSFWWKPFAVAHRDELPGMLTRSGDHFSEWHFKQHQIPTLVLLAGMSYATFLRNEWENRWDFSKQHPNFFQTFFLLLDLHPLKSSPFAMYFGVSWGGMSIVTSFLHTP